MFRRVHQMATPGAKLLCKTADALLLSECALVTYTVYYLKMGHATPTMPGWFVIQSYTCHGLRMY